MLTLMSTGSNFRDRDLFCLTIECDPVVLLADRRVARASCLSRCLQVHHMCIGIAAWWSNELFYRFPLSERGRMPFKLFKIFILEKTQDTSGKHSSNIYRQGLILIYALGSARSLMLSGNTKDVASQQVPTSTLRITVNK